MNGWHYIDGEWIDGNPLVMGVWSHAIWMGAAVFDGARAFEGVTPDLDRHCRRAVRSAATLGLRSPMPAERIQEIALDGVARFPKGTPLYIRPFLWSEDGYGARPGEHANRHLGRRIAAAGAERDRRLPVALPPADAGDRADRRQGGVPLRPGRPRQRRGQAPRLR
jgi:branched-chain amino acid aminotransferase